MAWEAPIGVISAVGGVGLGYLAYRRSVKVDATSAQSGVATENRAGIAQVVEGLKDLLEAVQQDAATMEARLRADLDKCLTRIESQETSIAALTVELARLRRKYGNGDEPTR